MMLGRTDSRGRLVFLLLVFLIFSGAIIARLGWWQIVQQASLAASAHRQIYLRTEVPAVRGTIYDRSGTVVLASTVIRNRLTTDPTLLSAHQGDLLVALLGSQLGLDDPGIANLRTQLASKSRYVVLARDLTTEKTDAITAAAVSLGIPGLAVEPLQVRQYPQSGGGPSTSLAATLLGFVNQDGKGQYGVEQYYQAKLAGTPTVVEADRDANGQAIVETQHIVTAGTKGADISLTIDAGLQLAVEQEVMAANVGDRSRSVSAVVMDPYTGAILAEATFPSYDANNYSAVANVDPGRFVDPVISQVYEPGSVFKMFTVIAALEAGTATMTTKFNDSGTIRLDKGKTQVSDANHVAMGPLTLEDAIAYSRNVVATRIALGLAPTTAEAASKLYGVWDRMGFTSRTGVDISGEVAGLVHDPSTQPWRQIDLANGSFGQGVAVTPLQLVDAYAAMMNGGTLVTPHVVSAIDGKPVTVPAGPRVLDPSLTPQLISLMNHVVTYVPFYAKGTLIPGYFVGGKTGTAQIWDPKTNDWKNNIFNFDFVGYIGRQTGRPDLAIAVLINEGRPTIYRTGQLAMPEMSFELFRRIATDAMSVPGLLPDLPPPVPDTGPTSH
jgi:cell division protein FtsI/penicillin-binding protein 2